jgi:hypothetical protein
MPGNVPMLALSFLVLILMGFLLLPWLTSGELKGPCVSISSEALNLELLFRSSSPWKLWGLGETCHSLPHDVWRRF